jgi:Beta-lactamase enzyme family
MRKQALLTIDTLAGLLIRCTPICIHNRMLRRICKSDLKAHQFIVMDVEDRSYFGHQEDQVIEHLASLNKVFIARAMLERLESKQLKLTDKTPFVDHINLPWDVIGGNIQENLSYMLNQSSNTATNVLTEIMGGYIGVTKILNDIGFEKTKINCYTEPSSYIPSPPESRNISTPLELANAMADIVQSSNLSFITPMVETEYTYTHSHRACNKAGVNSTTIANTCLIKVGGKEYVVVVFFRLSRVKIKIYTLLSEVIALQKSQNLYFKWDPISSFTQKVIYYLNHNPKIN